MVWTELNLFIGRVVLTCEVKLIKTKANTCIEYLSCFSSRYWLNHGTFSKLFTIDKNGGGGRRD